MALINVEHGPQDANDGRVTEGVGRVGNRRWGQKVYLSGTEQRIAVSLTGAFNNLGLMESLAFEGRLFTAGVSTTNGTVTGQTSFANTTPTFMIDVPANVACIPLFVNLTQAGSVAGGDVTMIIATDNILRYASGGTAMTVTNRRKSSGISNQCTVYSGATATNVAGDPIFAAVTAPDVSPAEGAVQGPYWSAELPYVLEGPAAFLVYTFAASTGPTFMPVLGFAEMPLHTLPRFGE
jgi:hypothetical protein